MYIKINILDKFEQINEVWSNRKFDIDDRKTSLQRGQKLYIYIFLWNYNKNFKDSEEFLKPLCLPCFHLFLK